MRGSNIGQMLFPKPATNEAMTRVSTAGLSLDESPALHPLNHGYSFTEKIKTFKEICQ